MRKLKVSPIMHAVMIRDELCFVFIFRELLGPVALRNLVLPGTHNAGSYRSYNGHHSDTVFTRYLVCQDEDIKYIILFNRILTVSRNVF